jgi:CelD/BcsL family acetyltransferase involved in cellulose biosynthesis
MCSVSTSPSESQIYSQRPGIARIAGWLTRADDADWNDFASSHPLGLVYHLSAWRNVLEHAFPHIQGRYLVLREQDYGEIIAGLPVYTVRSWLLGNRMVSVPFASFCDPLVSSLAEFRELLPQIQNSFGRENGRSVSVRTRQLTGEFAADWGAPEAGYKHHYLPLDGHLDRIFASFNKSSVRQKVNKAARAGVSIVEASGPEAMRQCHAILAETRVRAALPPIPLSFYLALEKFMSPQHLRIFLALQNGKPVACHLILAHKDLWISEYSGNSEDAIHGVNQLLYWETIKRAQEAGAAAFSFGRTSARNQGLLAYKRRWGTIEENAGDFSISDGSAPSRPGGQSVRNRDEGVPHRALRFMLARTPQPVCELIGKFCYKHLG